MVVRIVFGIEVGLAEQAQNFDSSEGFDGSDKIVVVADNTASGPDNIEVGSHFVVHFRAVVNCITDKQHYEADVSNFVR